MELLDLWHRRTVPRTWKTPPLVFPCWQLADDSTGFGHTSRQVGSVRVDSGELLLGYFHAVHVQTLRFVRGPRRRRPGDGTFDERWDLPVTLGVRLAGVLADDLQHAGQAAFVRGLLKS